MPIFKKSIKKEESASGKPQSLAISLSVQKKNSGKKKMAEGGAISAKDEKRPMPDDKYNDKSEAARNSGKKPPKDDGVESKVTEKQASSGKTVPLKQPPFVKSGAPFSVRDANMRDEEKDLISKDAPGQPKAQPPKQDDEKGADRQGKAPHPMKMMAEGGEAQNEQPARSKEQILTDMKMHQQGLDSLKKELYAAGGMIPKDHGVEEMERSDEANMEDKLSPGDESTEEYDEEGADRQGPKVHPMKMMAKGGNVDLEQSNKKPKSSSLSMENTEKPSSVTEAIMKQRKGSDDSMIELDSDEGNSEELLPMNKKAANSPIYDDDQLSDQPEDSNLKGDSQESDSENAMDQSMISMIRARLKAKRSS